MDPLNWLSFTAAAVLLTFMPGPDIMYLLTKSLRSGARQGITLAAGLASGPVFHTALVALGVAAFVQHSPAAFRALTFAGAAYLLWLSWGAFRAPAAPLALSAEAEAPAGGSLYRRGLLMNVLNPKVLLFFLALFPQFVDPDGSLFPQFVDPDGSLPAAAQLAVLGATFSVQAFLCFSLVALCAGKIRDRILGLKNFSLIMNRVEGTLLAAIAAGLLFL